MRKKAELDEIASHEEPLGKTEQLQRVSISGTGSLCSTSTPMRSAGVPRSVRRFAITWLILLGVGFASTSTATAQQSAGAIAGLVKDKAGSVLSDVTVEASSPALIEKSRAGTTDQDGAYRIVDLRPGTYTVTFRKNGFETVKEEGIELTQGFTAPLNVMLPVGAVSESVTVSAASPLIDVQSTAQTDVVGREALTSVPTAESFGTVVQLIPGVSAPAGTQDVGGSSGFGTFRMTIHGGTGTDMEIMVDGLTITNLSTGGDGTTTTVPPEGEIQEFNVEVGSHPADIEAGGVAVNIIPRTGGNDFHGGVYSNFANSSLQSSNLSPALQKLGITSTTRAKDIYSVTPELGGPILKDKLWFFTSAQRSVVNNYVANDYANMSTNPFIYLANMNAPAINDNPTIGWNARFTFQLSAKNRVNFFYEREWLCNCHLAISGVEAPEAAYRARQHPRELQSTWTSELTPKLFLEVGYGRSAVTPFQFATQFAANGSVGSNVSVYDSGLGYTWGSNANPLAYYIMNSWINHFRTSLSYVTAQHSLKFGADMKYSGQVNYQAPAPEGLASYTLLNGTPSSITFYPGPVNMTEHVSPNLGLYAEDKWTKKRLTANVGLRFDMLRTTFDNEQLAAAQYRPAAASFIGNTVLNWKDLDPRFGAIYDLFGNGKTALKLNAARYVEQEALVLTMSGNPSIASQAPTTRSWTEAKGNYVVTGNALNPVTNSDLGPSSNVQFGTSALTTTISPAYADGFGVRPHQWEFSGGVQQQIIPGMALTVDIVRRSYGNLQVTNNTVADSPSGYSTYCVTAPSDTRLPGGGGYQVCGLYDPNVSTFGHIANVITSASSFGRDTNVWKGGDVLINAHIRRAYLQGGIDTGKTTLDNCQILPRIGNPSQRFCHTETPFLTSFRLSGSYSLPWWGIQFGAAFQSNPGPNITAAGTFTNAQIAPSLGRNLSSGSTATVALVQPGTLYGDRANQLDCRFTKKFVIRERAFRNVTWQVDADLYNIFNTAPALTVNNTYGTSGAKWEQPAILLGPRLAKFGLRAQF